MRAAGTSFTTAAAADRPFQIPGLVCCSRAKLATEFVSGALQGLLEESQLDGTRDHCFRCQPAAVEAIDDGGRGGGKLELPRGACAFGLAMHLEQDQRANRIFAAGSGSYLAVSPSSLQGVLRHCAGGRGGAAGGGTVRAGDAAIDPVVTTPSAKYALFDPTHPSLDVAFGDGVVRRVKMVLFCKLANGSYTPRPARLTPKANNLSDHIPWESMERVSADGCNNLVPVRLLVYVQG